MSLQHIIEAKINAAFAPVHFELINESPNHNVPDKSESHFRLSLVSSQFEEIPLVRRHQLVYSALSSELSNHIHALSLHLYTPEEWVEQNPAVSPNCLGGGISSGK